jgi:hypothetical protein
MSATGGRLADGPSRSDHDWQEYTHDDVYWAPQWSLVAVSSQDPSWVRVDLEGDGLLDGYVFASFIASAELHASAGEGAPEPA